MSNTIAPELLNKAKTGDLNALDQLLGQHQQGVEKAIKWQLDRRISRREDVQDIVQETLLTAANRFAEYVEKHADLQFGVWLRLLARDRVIDAHRKHFGADCRNINREQYALPQHSSVALVGALVGREQSPSKKMARAEIVDQMSKAISMLEDQQRELIMWRHFEHLSIRDTAVILQIGEAAANKRYVRALESLRKIVVSLGFHSQ